MIKAREDIIGKTITGVIARDAGRGRNPSLLMLQFSDGTYYEFVSPGALKMLSARHSSLDMGNVGNSANDNGNLAPQLAIAGV